MNCQINRTPITTALTSSPQPISSPAEWPEMLSITDGSCSPTSRNSSALSRNVSTSQIAMP